RALEPTGMIPDLHLPIGQRLHASQQSVRVVVNCLFSHSQQLLENLSRKDVAPIRGSPYNLMAYDIVLHNFRSSLYKRGPLCGRFNANFPIRLCPRERRCSRRPKRCASSVAPKPSVKSSKDNAFKTSRTRSSLPILPCANGCIALPIRVSRAWWIALAPVDPRKSRVNSKSISTASSIKTPWSTAPSLPNGAVVNSPRFSPNKLGSNSVVSVSELCEKKHAKLLPPHRTARSQPR